MKVKKVEKQKLTIFAIGKLDFFGAGCFSRPALTIKENKDKLAIEYFDWKEDVAEFFSKHRGKLAVINLEISLKKGLRK